ncbi:MAG: uptake protein [Bacteroidetes bacterium]|nr:uptake protein [Bacteroidota bacterium]
MSPAPIVVKDLPLIEEKADNASRANSKNKKQSFYTARKLFAFDPNKASKEQLLQLGLKDKTAGILIKFRDKGFKFRKKEDLKKVFGITDRLYSSLEPYILIDNTGNTPSVPEKKTFKTSAIKIVELNAADSLQLLEMNGIGPAFAKRILKYRSMLGGFVYPEQLKEVYGFTEEMYAKLANQITVNDAQVLKLNVNKDDFKTLNRHPYLSYELTKEICNRRRKETLTEVQLKELIADEVVFKKLLPYLQF